MDEPVADENVDGRKKEDDSTATVTMRDGCNDSSSGAATKDVVGVQHTSSTTSPTAGIKSEDPSSSTSSPQDGRTSTATTTSPPTTTTTTTTTNPVVAPARLQSDRAAPTLSSSQPPKQQPQRPHRKRDFLQRANALFGRRGLSFFGSDLALCSWNALRVIETALDIYGAALLEPELSRLAAESTSS
mmetsp:Transcript_28448/g.78143  ORF Transcript_28448/g.78143 Transcript_28448/m.78143 type:complete len:187 (+) Transcript_28448:237-797(+)